MVSVCLVLAGNWHSWSGTPTWVYFAIVVWSSGYLSSCEVVVESHEYCSMIFWTAGNDLTYAVAAIYVGCGELAVTKRMVLSCSWTLYSFVFCWCVCGAEMYVTSLTWKRVLQTILHLILTIFVWTAENQRVDARLYARWDFLLGDWNCLSPRACKPFWSKLYISYFFCCHGIFLRSCVRNWYFLSCFSASFFGEFSHVLFVVDASCDVLVLANHISV